MFIWERFGNRVFFLEKAYVGNGGNLALWEDRLCSSFNESQG